MNWLNHPEPAWQAGAQKVIRVHGYMVTTEQLGTRAALDPR